MASCAMKKEGPGLECLSVASTPSTSYEGGGGCGEGRVEEGGGVRGCEVSRRSVRGYHTAVCVHVDTQSG
jgi:hypothetical protein